MGDPQWNANDLADRLFDDHYENLFGYLYRLTGDRQHAADLATQALAAGVRDRHVRAADATQRAWLYRIATDLALYGRFPRPWRTRLPWAAPGGPTSGVDEAAASATWGQPDVLDGALARLPAHERAPVLLYGRCGLAIDEIAVALGLRAIPARAALTAAREHFREIYVQTSMS
jgi:DNA-directed RNA polymerase specialized sigma24 family protein